MTKVNKTEIQILPNDFPCRKKIVDIFQNHLWNHPFWITPPNPLKPKHGRTPKITIPEFNLKSYILGNSNILPRLKEIKIFMDSDLEGNDHIEEYTQMFGLILMSINLTNCVKHKLLKKVINPGEEDFPYEVLTEKDFDFERFSKYLSHEIGRIIDMLDSSFNYWRAFGWRINEKLTPKLEPHFFALWDLYIDGRLFRKKVPLLCRKEKTFFRLKDLYGYSNRKLFERIWDSDSLTYNRLVEEAQKAYQTGKLMGHIDW